jgi:F0F1-type ATP synthase membrane subunit c/vacuolar-type H+-ATPase subunit K
LLLLLLLPMLAVRPAAVEAKGVAVAITGSCVSLLLGVAPAAATAAAVRKSSARPKQASCMEKRMYSTACFNA